MIKNEKFVKIQCSKHFDKNLFFYRKNTNESQLYVVFKSSDVKIQKWVTFDLEVFYRFFKSMEDNWKGWSGEKSVVAANGDMTMIATSDRLGHITMAIELLAQNLNFSTWSFSSCVVVQAGQLEGICKEIKELLVDASWLKE